MNSKGKDIIEKLKSFEKGKAITELVEALKNVDTKAVNAKLNEISMEDGEGRRIYYFLTEEDIRRLNIGKNDLKLNESKGASKGVLKRFLNVLLGASILGGGLLGYLAWISNKPVVLWLIVYYLAVEVIRRTFLYVFFNRSFLS